MQLRDENRIPYPPQKEFVNNNLDKIIKSNKQIMKTKMFKLTSSVVMVMILMLSLNSCGKSKKASQEETVSKELIKTEVEKFAYPLPSTFELTSMLNKIEASYIIGITNEAEKAADYLTESSKALNLGVYSADLAYATTYNNNPNVQSYFKASETLIRELDITGAFSTDLAEQIETNQDNKEKMTETVTGMFQDAYSYLNKQDRSEVSYLILAGTLIEGLYLTTNISQNTFENPEIIKTIMFQKEPLLKLESMMTEYKDSELTAETLAAVQSINAIYAKEEGSSSFSKEQIASLTSKIKEVRSAVVK